LLEIPEAAICCGSAEIYNLVQPEAATQLGDRKAAHVAALDADMVVSGNPPAACCSAAAPVCPPARRGESCRRHIVELLDASIRGISI
jgi:glycolate oxidase iron-sulfur subunit